MKFLLDTNICIYIANEKPPSVRERMDRTNPMDLAVSSITLAELHFGVAKSARPEQNKRRIEVFLERIAVLDFTPKDAQTYGTLRASLEHRGEIIGGNDLLIAAQALERNLILVTNNEREFRRIKQLKIENWAS